MKNLLIVEAIRKAYDSPEFWDLLIKQSKAQSGPLDGGCLICANALIKAFGGELVHLAARSVKNENESAPQHYGAIINGVIYDFLGAHRSEDWPSNFAEAEHCDKALYVSNGRPDLEQEIPDDPKVESQLAGLLQSLTPNPQVEVDGVSRPTLNSLGRPVHNTQEGIRNFWRWFRESVAVDARGRPLVLFHGTGSLEGMERFDPAFTGQGNDQIGSGFYFTTDPTEASGYAYRTANLGNGEVDKLGGSDSPGVVAVYLALQKPIRVNGTTLTDSDVELTERQAFEIIRAAPDIYDMDDTPLWNWIDLSRSSAVSDAMIRSVAKQYVGPNLISIENDFFRGHATQFREALMKSLPNDGVTMNFETKSHFVAWRPHQVKSAIGNSGRFDPDTDDLVDFSLPKRKPKP